MEAKAVYKAIADVSAEIAKSGISKDRKNEQQGYKFRGIDDVYNALAPMLAKHGLVILPRILSRSVVERTTKNGGVLFYVVVEAEYDFVAVADGSIHVVRMYGEAMDSGDKATNKATSAGYKYACMQAFCIPTEGDNDTENKTHEVVPTVPAGYEDWVMDLELEAAHGLESLRKAFKASKQEYCDHRTTVDKQRHEALKKRAEGVKAKPQEAA